MNDFGAISLDGSTQYGTASSQDEINFALADFCLDVAFTVAGGSGVRVLLGKWVANVGWRIQVDGSGSLQVLFNDLTYTASATINDDEWHYLQATVDRSTNLVYILIDGVLDGTLDISGSVSVSNAADLELGWNGTDSYWNGKVSEVRLSNRARNTSAFTQDVIQFPDDYWTVTLYHFNEGINNLSTIYDFSTTRNHMTMTGSPNCVAGPFEECPPVIVIEQVWLALDSYANLNTFLNVRKENGSSRCKFRFRPGDHIPGDFTAEFTPALLVVPATMPEIEPETSAFHRIKIPVEVQGKLHHKAVFEIQLFWWLAVVAMFQKYESNTTAGRFNYARIQHASSQGPSFEVQELKDNSLFSSFTDTWLFEVRHDLLS